MQSLDLNSPSIADDEALMDKAISRALWMEADYDSEVVSSVVEMVGTEADIRIFTEFSQVEAYLKEAIKPRLYLLYAPPVPVLCQAMARGETPKSTLAAWRERASAQLRVLRRHRGKVTAISMAQIALYPQAFLERVGISADKPSIVDAPVTDPVLELFAVTALTQDVVAKGLNDELSVSAVDLSAGESIADFAVDAIFQQYHNLVGMAAEGKISRHEDQIASTEELGHLHDAIEAQTNSIALLIEQIELLQEITENQDAEHESTKDVLKRKQKEMEGYFGELQIEKSRTLKLVETNKALSENIFNLEQSSQTLVEQLSSMKDENKRFSEANVANQKAIGTLNKETDLLRQQLVHMQAEVNRYYEELSVQIDLNRKQREEYEKRLHQLNQGIESYQKQLDEAEGGKNLLLEQIQSLHDVRNELEAYYEASQNLEEELIRIRASWSYKLTAPLRWLRRASGKKAL